jgi:hypothetical protein
MKTKRYRTLLLLIFTALAPVAGQEFPSSAVTDHYSFFSTSSAELPGWITRLEAIHADFTRFWGEPPSGSAEKITVYLITDPTDGSRLVSGLGLSGGDRYPLLIEGIFPDDDKLVILIGHDDADPLLALFSRVYLRRRFGPLPEGITRGFSLYAGSGDKHFVMADRFRDSAGDPLPFGLFIDDNAGGDPLLMWAMAVYYAEAPDSPPVRAFREYLILRGGDPRYNIENPDTADRLFDDAFKKDFTLFWSMYPTPSLLTVQAISLYKKKDYDGSKALLTKLLPTAGDYRIPYYLGLMAVEQKKYADALSYFEQAGGLGAPEALTAWATGVCWWYLNDRDKGTSALNRAAELNPALFGERVYRLTGKKAP